MTVTPAVRFPDAAAVAIDYLVDAFASHGITAEVHHSVPQTRPDRFVTVVRGGGPRGSIIEDKPTLMVECWGTSDADAEDLAQDARALFHAMRGAAPGGVAIYRVDEFSGPATLPDPASGHPRSVFTLSIGMRGSDLGEGS